MRLIRDATYFALGWLCFVAYTRLPWRMVKGRFGNRLLPKAGMYAYSESWADFRECVQWNADGRP